MVIPYYRKRGATMVERSHWNLTLRKWYPQSKKNAITPGRLQSHSIDNQIPPQAILKQTFAVILNPNRSWPWYWSTWNTGIILLIWDTIGEIPRLGNRHIRDTGHVKADEGSRSRHDFHRFFLCLTRGSTDPFTR